MDSLCLLYSLVMDTVTAILPLGAVHDPDYLHLPYSDTALATGPLLMMLHPKGVSIAVKPRSSFILFIVKSLSKTSAPIKSCASELRETPSNTAFIDST